MWESKFVKEGLTFDDVLLIPAKSEVLPRDVSLKVQLASNLNLNIPLISAGMDTVTEADMAISIARQGGLGIIHKNMSIEQQAEQVDKVKRSESGVITDPFFLTPDHQVFDAEHLMGKYRISGVPIVNNNDDQKLVGILTNRDLRFIEDFSIRISDVMTKENLVTAPVGTTLEEAEKILQKYKIEKLPLINSEGVLKGLITIKDIEKVIEFPNSAKDAHGRLLVGAAVGVTGDALKRVEMLVKSNVDVVVLDTAHGHSQGVLEGVKEIRNAFPELTIIAGNVYYQQASISPLSIQPLLVFYGYVHLLKACLLTIDPSYPSTTSVLAHGVSTRKRKKQQYLFFQDEVKIQKNGLFTYMAEKMFSTKSLEGEKVKMEELFRQIPELTNLFKIMNGNDLYLPVTINNTTISIPIQILDTYFMNLNGFKHYLEQKNQALIMDINANRHIITINYNELPYSMEPLKYNICTKNYYISIMKEGSAFFPEILSHYLILYNLSMIARYEIEWWSELLKTTPNQDFPFIESFLSISIQKGPYLIYRFLEKNM